MNNISLITIICALEAIGLVIILALILVKFPYQQNAFIENLYPYFRLDIHPEREMFLYRTGVIFAIVLMGILIVVWRKRLDDIQFQQKLRRWMMVMGGMIFVQLYLVFKVFVAPDQQWPINSLWVVSILAVFAKIFFGEINQAIVTITQRTTIFYSSLRVLFLDIAIPLSVIALIGLTDLKQALALIFYSDSFYHLDGFIMSAIWAIYQGLELNVDIHSPYGIVMPNVVFWLLNSFSTINYENLVITMMLITIVYWVFFYFFLKRISQWPLLAAIATLLAIKWQTFHEGVVPIIWRYGTPTVLRFFFDIIVLAFLFEHARSNKQRWLWLAVITTGISTAWMIDTGVYLSLAVSIYVVGYVVGMKRDWQLFLRLIGFMPIMTIIILGIVSKGKIIDPLYLQRMFEHAGLFLAGFGSLPITDAINQQQFYCFFKGLIIPVIYVGVALWYFIKILQKQYEKRDVWILTVCVYGLGLYHYYVNRSAYTSFDVVCVPLVIVLAHLFVNANQLWPRVTKTLGIILTICIVLSLVTNRLLPFYPNIFYHHTDALKQIRGFYDQYADFSKDGDLIESLTTPGEPVAVISSFELALLMAANRPAYFYYTPIIESHHWISTDFRGTYLHQQDRINKIQQQWQRAPARTVVIEKKLLNPRYQQERPTLAMLFGLLGNNYSVIAQGQWIVVLQRNNINNGIMAGTRQ